MTLKISALSREEIPIAADIIQTVFRNYRDKAEEEFSRLSQGEAHPTHVFLAKKDGSPVGVAACMEVYLTFDLYGLCWVAVLEEHRRQGIGAALIAHAESYISVDLLRAGKARLFFQQIRPITIRNSAI